MTEKTITSLLALVYNDLKSGIGKGAKAFQGFLNDYLKEYLIIEESRFSKSKTFLHRSAPVDFYKVFVAPNVRKGLDKGKINTTLINRFLKTNDRLGIQGEAGSGKSTLLKHIFLTSIQDQRSIPIFIELRRLTEIPKNWNITDLINWSINLKVKTNNLSKIEKLAKEGKLTLLLDGLDELPSEIRIAISDILSSAATKYQNCSIVLSSRPYSGLDIIPNFTSVEMLPFDEELIKLFINRQGLDKTLEKKILGSINKGHASGLSDFMRNPLLLSLYVLTFTSYPDIPNKKSTFYRRVFDTLFSEHDSLSKLGYERPKSTSMTQDEFQMIAEKFSLITYVNSEFHFDKYKLKELFKKLKTIPGSPQFEDKYLIKDLVSAIGLWSEDAGFFQFCHRSLQEFFAALCISKMETESKSDVYSKLLSENYDQGFSGELRNFLSLCEELDELSYLKYLKIPTIYSLTKDIPTRGKFTAIKSVYGGLCKELVIGFSDHKKQNFGPNHMVNMFGMFGSKLTYAILDVNCDNFSWALIKDSNFLKFLKSKNYYDELPLYISKEKEAIFNLDNKQVKTINFSKRQSDSSLMNMIYKNKKLNRACQEFCNSLKLIEKESIRRLNELTEAQKSTVDLL